VFKLARMLSEASSLKKAIWDARGKIIVFLTTVLIVVTIAGPAMYFVENLNIGQSSGDPHFTSIPQAMYWAIVTMTTVGYGDIVPQTTLGKFLSAILIMVGYSLIIVPTGFVSAELVHARSGISTQACPSCMAEGHPPGARFCHRCGHTL
jgi:voltage-gated potassium channel